MRLILNFILIQVMDTFLGWRFLSCNEGGGNLQHAPLVTKLRGKGYKDRFLRMQKFQKGIVPV